MLTVGKAESAYWDLYLTQEQERISRRIPGHCGIDLGRQPEPFKVGRTSEIEVQQAEAGVALRRARMGEAKQSGSTD